MADTVDLSKLAPGLTGELARPTGAGPWPGVVVLFEGAGPDDVNRRLNERMAAAGYLTLMPDLFRGKSAVRCMVSTMKQMAAGFGPAFSDIDAARRSLLDNPECNGKVGVIGFCMGGGFALLLAKTGKYQVVAANYGQMPKDDDMAGACPVVASYGGKDKAFRSHAGKLEQALDRAGVEHDVKTYPEAGHSFLNDAPNGPAVLRPLMKAVMGVGPDPVAAADAWLRIEGFFKEHLK